VSETAVRIDIRNLVVDYGEVRAVDDVSLSVGRGELVTLLGPSGCGKTTTLRAVAGLEDPTGGSIALNGTLVWSASERRNTPAEKRGVSMVFQSYAIWPHMTVFDNVAYPLSVRHVAKAEIRERVTAALRLVEMERYADRPAPALSGGQQQRVAIARALVFEPEVLLLDEPLSNLDARLRTTMGEEFRALQRRLGITTLYVTHDQEEAMALSDRVVVMQRGRIQQIGTPEEVYRRPANREVAAFFGTPNLIEATVTASEIAKDNEHLLTIEGMGWRGQCRAGRAFGNGDKVLVVVRPEDATLAPAETTVSERQFAWRGRIVDGVFRGPRRSLSIETDVLRFRVECPATRAMAVGQNATVLVDSHNAWAIHA
jgi:iron(III) transport system ATP-binding protein